MEHDTADELHTVVDHIPGDFVATGEPVVLPDGVVAFDAHEILALSGKLAVKVCGFNHDGFAGCKAGSGLAEGCEHYGEVLVEFILYDIKHSLLIFVNFVPDGLTLVEGELLYLNFQAGVLLFA